ncbi:SDR family oxidoreductase [Pseudoalteromonas sp. PS5]|uniref:dTDP-4-dehydrorhamnose reductase family protein n=1 Tax=Pseudoalteromonas sp. PS5 TaxID=1437473 RepID=UPI000FFE9027|nr:SDR family oxidoreductase [Pseudoalteromonas sp. PS5]RXF02695.1 SDR family oxidoreductase [Pseudoalteromonas sp. PS5]
MSTVMITGATGLLGRALCQKISHHHTVIGCGFSRAVAPLHQLDLGDQTAVLSFLDTHQPDYLIHAAAERRPEYCERDHQGTLALNVAATEFLAKTCRQRGIRFFFISTDYVFDGTSPPYLESDPTHPINFYGETKQAAERAIIADSELHTIVRVPVLYGEVTTLKESAVTIIAQQLLDSPSASHDHWAIRYPTHVDDIALTLNDVIANPDVTGIIHISGNQAFTKYEMATIMAQILDVPSHLVTSRATPSGDAKRPKNCALKDTRLLQYGINHQRDFATAVADVLSTHMPRCQ